MFENIADDQRRNHMYWFIIGCISLAIMTYAIPMATLNIGGRYTAMMLMPCASGESRLLRVYCLMTVGPQLLLYKTINHHLPRPVAKRAAAVAMMNSIGGTSNIWASYLYYAPPKFYAAIGCCKLTSK